MQQDGEQKGEERLLELLEYLLGPSGVCVVCFAGGVPDQTTPERAFTARVRVVDIRLYTNLKQGAISICCAISCSEGSEKR